MRTTAVKRLARLRTRVRLVGRECAALAPLRQPRSGAAIAAAMPIVLARCAQWILRGD